MDWYQTIAIIAFLIAAGAGWEVLKLRKHLHMDDLTPTKKWKKAFSGTKYVPKHKQDQVPTYTNDDEWHFFKDFSHVADYLNELHADGPWSFENTGRLNNSHHGSQYGSEREILIRYNQQKTGTIKLRCIGYRDDDSYDLNAELSLQNGRAFPGASVFHMALSLGELLTRDKNETQENKSTIIATMIDAIWQVSDEALENPELELTFRGNAEWFLKYWAPKLPEHD